MNDIAKSGIINAEAVSAFGSLRLHWPEYLMEAGELAVYMFFACTFATLFQHPGSPFGHLILSAALRRLLTGLALGATVVAIIMSPWGKQSGGHFNPAITLAFYRLGKVDPWDVLFYAAGHFLGAIVGVALAVLVLRGASGDGAVRYAVTVPGVYGYTAAFIGELTLSFILMTVLLFVSNHDNLARYTPYVAGALIATYITFEAPLSGMSTNPARTFGSAFYARCWRGIWIYFTAPPLGMLGAAEFFCELVGVSLLIAQSCTTRRISVVYSTTGLFIRKSRRKSENEKLLLVENIERRPKRLKM